MEKGTKEMEKFYKGKKYLIFSSLWIVSMSPGDRKVAGCFNLSDNFGGFL